MHAWASVLHPKCAFACSVAVTQWRPSVPWPCGTLCWQRSDVRSGILFMPLMNGCVVPGGQRSSCVLGMSATMHVCFCRPMERCHKA
jgi:hypothetical protein